ncbi:hypothetical protein ACOBQB_12730 [Streptomyces sp. G5(2025)]|uniref:hypothetical protein n=1 Tax=Streptomyces sp. G5(2025) TaxID=3406628 RepID=UPI003C1322E1
MVGLLDVRSRNDDSRADWVDLPAFHMGELGDKPGYYRFLVWPQAAEGQDGFSHQYSWDPSKPEDAFQTVTVHAPQGMRFHRAPPVLGTQRHTAELVGPGRVLRGRHHTDNTDSAGPELR